MYRTIGNEKVELGRANSPEVSARKTGFAALGVFANRSVNSVRRTLERAAIARELSALDDRELSDIGLGRGDTAAGMLPNRDLMSASIFAGSKSPTAITAIMSGRYQSV